MKKIIVEISIKKSYNCFSNTDLHFYKILSVSDKIKKDGRKLSYEQLTVGLSVNTLANYFDKEIIYREITQDEKCALLHIQPMFIPEDSKKRVEASIILTKLGFKLGKYWEIPEVKDMYEERNRKEEERRKKAGYIVWRTDYKKMKPEEYQGGFSDKLFNTKCLQEYVKGAPFGYIGSSERKAKYDKKLEKQFMKLQPKIECDMYEVLANWLTSSDGRHYADNLETQSMNIEQMKKMWNAAWIFMKSEHTGIYGSTVELEKKYKKELF